VPIFQRDYPLTAGLVKQLQHQFNRAWPGVCCVCAQITPGSSDLCEACRSHFPYLEVAAAPYSAAAQFMTLCLACGLPLTGEARYCAKCAKKPSPYAHIVVPFRFAHPIDRLITGLKYGEKLHYGRVLGLLLAKEAKRVSASTPDGLLPMPMHRKRFCKRGFNQAQELAHWCGASLNIPVQAHWAQRHIDTPSLAGLNRGERELEIRGSFTASDAVAGQHIAIVDDVLTTGASSAELARELYDTGARDVSLWVVARTARAGANQAEFINMRLSEAGNADSSKSL